MIKSAKIEIAWGDENGIEGAYNSAFSKKDGDLPLGRIDFIVWLRSSFKALLVVVSKALRK